VQAFAERKPPAERLLINALCEAVPEQLGRKKKVA